MHSDVGFCCKSYCYDDVTSNKLKFSGKILKHRVLEQCGDGPLESIAASWTKKKDFCVNKQKCPHQKSHEMAKYLQIKKEPRTFIQKQLG